VLRQPLPFLPRRDVRCRTRSPWRLIEHRDADVGKACTQCKNGAAAKFQQDHGFVAGTIPAICTATMFSGEASGRATERQASELRRYSREGGPWPVVLETRDGWLRLPLIDLSPGGAKVRLTERLTEGTRGRLYFLPPHWHPRAVDAIVWRIDLDGIVLRFANSSLGAPPAARAVCPDDGSDSGWPDRSSGSDGSPSGGAASGASAPSAGGAAPLGPGEGAARMNHWIKGCPNEGTITFWVKPPRPADLTDTSASRFPTAGHGGITVETAKNSDRTITVTLNGTRGGPFTLQRPIPPCASLGLHVRITWNADTVILYLNELEAGRINPSPH
jgi:hypothetical protein